MKKFLFLLFIGLLSEALFAQVSVQPIQNQRQESFRLNKSENNYEVLKQQSSSKSSVSRWYNYGETMQQYHGIVSPLYYNYLFPDSTILVNYTSGYGSPWIHKLGDVLDVTSVMFNDPAIHPNALTIDALTKYKLDSLYFHCMYDRNIANPSIVDTLLFEISVNDNLLQAYFAPGVLSPNLSTDSIFMKRIPYNYLTNSLSLPNKKIYKVPLTAQTFADSLSNGMHIIKIATDSLPKVNPGKLIFVSVSFIPGYTWIANTDVIESKNSILFVSRKEQDNQFPHYTKKDYNISYILPTDVRYNYAGSWNANYIPSFAYMGTTPTYNFEHHLIYYKISTAFKITYQSQNVSCNGENDGFINMNISGGSSPYNFIWNNGATTQNLNNLTAGTYVVTITDQTPDTAVRIFYITQPTALLANVSTTPASSCSASDGAIVVSGIQGGVLSYSIVVLNADSITQTLTDLPAGIYTVKITDANGCKFIKHVAINEQGAPTHTVTQNNISCFGLTDGSINLTVNNPQGTVNYLWSTGQTTASLSNLSTGNYIVTITYDTCHIYESIVISQPQPLNVNGTATNSTGTNGSIIIQVTGGTSPYTYSWSAGQTTQNLGSLAPGTYTVTVTDSKQCTFEKTFVVQAIGGINDVESAFSFNILPNPASGFINLTFKGISNKSAVIKLYDVQGKIIKSQNTFVQEGSKIQIDINSLSQGIYFAELAFDGNTIKKKFIKK